MVQTNNYDGHVRKSKVRSPKSERSPKTEIRRGGSEDAGSFALRISDFGFGAQSWIVKRRKEVNAPEGQQHENEGANGAERKPPSALGKFPSHDHQTEIQQPRHEQRDNLRVVTA